MSTILYRRHSVVTSTKLVYGLSRTRALHDTPNRVHQFSHLDATGLSQRIVPARGFSMTASAQYPGRSWRPSQSRFMIGGADRAKKTNNIDPEIQKTQVQLETAANLITRLDDEHSKSLGTNAETRAYITMVLSRIQPILQYSLYHTDHEFFHGYAPVGTPLDRARDAATYLFISAHAWAILCYSAAESRSESLDIELLAAISRFHKAISIIESYLEEKPPEGITWSSVGAEILGVSRLAWPIMVEYAETDATTEPDNAPQASDTSEAANGTPCAPDGTSSAADGMPTASDTTPKTDEGTKKIS